MSTEQGASHPALLTLLQLTDSFFPTGAFAHSFGLETYVQRGLVTDATTFQAFLRASLRYGVRQMDAIAVALTHSASERHDIQEVVNLDARLTAMKLPHELREGSIRIGKQFLRNARQLFAHEMLDAYGSRIQSGACAGHQAVAYGLATAAASIELHIALLGYLHAYVTGQVSAAVRLIPLGTTDGQRTIQAVRSELLDIAAFAQGAQLADLGNFTPGLDIRSMQHERLYSRLFIS